MKRIKTLLLVLLLAVIGVAPTKSVLAAQAAVNPQQIALAQQIVNQQVALYQASGISLTQDQLVLIQQNANNLAAQQMVALQAQSQQALQAQQLQAQQMAALQAQQQALQAQQLQAQQVAALQAQQQALQTQQLQAQQTAALQVQQQQALALQNQQVQAQQQKTSGGSYIVNGKNGKIHIVGGCTTPPTEQPIYVNSYQEATAVSTRIAPGLAKRNCGNCYR